MKAKVAQRGAAAARAGPASAARGRSTELARAVQLARTAPASLDWASLLTLQAHSGNAAVAELFGGATVIDLRRHPRFGETRDAAGGRGPGVVVQLQPATACPPPPVVAPPVEPHDDPGFQAVKGRVGSAAAETKDHPPAKAKAKEAQAAAAGPSNEAASQAGAAHIDDMSEQKPGTFDKEAFIAAVHKAVDDATPKKMDDVEQFKKSGKAGEIKEKVAGQVTGSKDAAAKDIRGATETAPDPGKAKPTAPLPMQEEHPGSPPGDVGAQQAMPPPKKPEEVDLGHTACATDCRMAEAGITKEQVDKSNEPQFHQALDAKQKADDQAAKAPDQFRQQEQAKLEQAKTGSAAGTHAHLAGMHGAKVAALSGVSGHKTDTKAADEKEKAELARDLEGIFTDTKGEVTKILADLDKTVADTFDSGEKEAKAAFENHVEQKRSERYSGIAGAALWLTEKILPPPPEVNNFITEGRDLYVRQMDGVIGRIADTVARELTHAKEVIATGRQKVKERIAKLSPRLREEGEKAAAGMEEKFGQLDHAVDEKQQSIVSDLAQKYVAARDAVDEEANKMREENKSLTEKAVEEVEETAGTLMKMKDMLLGVLAKAGDVIDTIIHDPIAFLGNLVGAVKQGLGQFVSNIGKHLQAGLMGWLLGELADAGITMPDKFDLRGILHLVAQVLGFTWDHIKELARKVLGDPIMAMIEKGSEVVQKVMGIFETLKNEGIAGLWHMIVDKIGDLKDAVIGRIKDFVITKVIVAGVTWLVSLLNPASAFVKACKAIYDVVMFFVERGKAIVELVNTILDNLGAIASGALGAAANLVETVLAKILPVAISFLASLLGVGGLSTKIKEIIEAVRKPVDKALTWVLTTVVKPVAKLAMKGLKWIGGKIKAGVAWVKGKVAKGKAWAKKKAADVAGIFSVKEAFSVDGEQHSVYSTGGSGQLMVASKPTSLEGHPDQAVKDAYTAYRKSVDAAATPNAKQAAAKGLVGGVITALKKWLETTGTKDPQASAPGIGNIAPHRNQPSSLRTVKVPVWELESEHVIPRGVTNAAFKGVRLDGIPGRSSDYEAQHTILIYRGAAKRKTHPADADNAMTRRIKEAIGEPTRGYGKKVRTGAAPDTDASTLWEEYERTKLSQRGQVARLMFDIVINILSEYAEDDVKRTVVAIDEENKENGSRRGKPGSPEPPTPSHGRVTDAMRQQTLDIKRQLEERLSS